MKALVAAALALVSCALIASGCGEAKQAAAAPVVKPKPTCAYPAGWQRLANRIKAPVYCPGWLPDPLTSQIGGRWNNIDSVSKDRSWLQSFVWQETGGGAAGGELHVNLRGYPGETKVPSCNGEPCFSGERGTREVAGRSVDVYTVNHGADTWHVLYAWKDDGSLYSVSQHVVPELGLSYSQVVKSLDRIMAGLVKIEPQQS